MVSQSTFDKVGKREICLKTTGHEKVRISICLNAKTDGTKFKPFIVFGGVKRETEALNKVLFPLYCYIFFKCLDERRSYSQVCRRRHRKIFVHSAIIGMGFISVPYSGFRK